jgi:hypothetical protein
MPNVYIDAADVFVDITDDELMEEVKNRGLINSLDLNTVGVDADEMRLLLEQIWIRRRQGEDYQALLDQFIYMGLGKLV